MVTTGKFTKAHIDRFLENPILARLSTAVPRKDNPTQFQPHITPVWFSWDGISLYISAFQSTRKVKEVRQNPYIAVLIDVAEPFDGLTAVLIEGKSELILEPETVQTISRTIYTRYMGEEGVKGPEPQSWIVDQENSIIKITPVKIITW